MLPRFKFFFGNLYKRMLLKNNANWLGFCDYALLLLMQKSMTPKAYPLASALVAKFSSLKLNGSGAHVVT